MPPVSLDRIPLPNLKLYSVVSVAALAACVYFATETIRQQPLKPQDGVLNAGQFISDVFSVMIREPVCVWTMINMAFCWLILAGRGIQKLVFGELRVSEQQHLKDKFWNFVFYKFIFVFGIINVQYIDEVLLWCSWFALIGFLHLLSALCKDRFEYLSFSPTTPVWNHVKLMCLLGVIFMVSSFMLLVAVFVGFFGGINTFAFMSAEVVLLGVKTLHTIIRYGLHLYDMRQEGGGITSATDENKVWERRGPIAYYVELGFELSALTIDFVHHLHMLVWSNIFLSMASLVICMQLRYLFHEIQRRYKKHRNYLWVRNHLEQNYPMATSEEISENCDNCAICWEKMESARKLPCGHLFHNTCLLSWLEQDTSCPTCRLGLSIQAPSSRPESAEAVEAEAQPRRQLNHFFHFDGSRYVSWLPSFSVEVSHAHLTREQSPSSTSQMESMARQVQSLFPHFPLSLIMEDLRISRSVELTIENILDGRLNAPMIREPEQPNIPLSLLNENEQASSWEELVSAESSEEAEDLKVLGSRFSKSSAEREHILQKRKEILINVARKRYIEKQKALRAAQSLA